MIAPLAGFLAGAAHAASGPDHLAAVAPLTSADSGRGWRVGAQWGIGHALAVATVGCLALGTRHVLPWDLVSNISERLVGVILIGLGLWGIRRAFRHRLHSHDHHHGHDHDHSVPHRHPHLHLDAPEAGRRTKHSHGHTAFGIGALHGLAGGSHMLAAVAALAFPSVAEAGFYLVAYAGGTVAAMALFSEVLSRIVRRGEGSEARRAPFALGLCSLAAVVCGGFWLVG